MYLRPYRQMRPTSNRKTNPVSLFDELFDDFLGPVLHMTNQPGKSGSNRLQVDIYEQQNAIIIEADMPGVKKEDIKLDVKGKSITLKGERKRDEEVNDEKQYRRERFLGTYERSFNLPFEIESDAVSAKFENGTLHLEITKPEEKETKQITIS